MFLPSTSCNGRSAAATVEEPEVLSCIRRRRTRAAWLLVQADPDDVRLAAVVFELDQPWLVPWGVDAQVWEGRQEEGMILSYDPAAGTGLVAPHSDGGEVFVHATSIARRDRKTLVVGDPVTFRTVDGAYRDLVTKLRNRR